VKRVPKGPIDSSRSKNKRPSTISFISKTGERKMAVLNAVAGGFDVSAAHAIVANMTILPPPPAVGKTSALRVTFNPDKAGAGCSMIGTLTRDLSGGGTQVNAISTSPTGGEVVVPLGAFTGRKVSYTVADPDPGVRTLTLKIRSLDGYGVNEIWRLEIVILNPPAGTTDFQLRAGTNLTVDSVNVTP
jgi:hypothetical protein